MSEPVMLFFSSQCPEGKCVGGGRAEPATSSQNTESKPDHSLMCTVSFHCAQVNLKGRGRVGGGEVGDKERRSCKS